MTTLIYGRYDVTFSTQVESLPAKALEYLLQYGWAQSLQDSIAGAEKTKRLELMETDQFKVMLEANREQFLADEVQLHILAKLEARMKSIMDGTIGARVGQPRLPGRARRRRTQAARAG